MSFFLYIYCIFYPFFNVFVYVLYIYLNSQKQHKNIAMGKKDYSLKFIRLGKDKKTYLRYYYNGKTLNLNCNINVILSDEDIKKLNLGTLGGVVQKEADKIKHKVMTNIYHHNFNTNKPPSVELLKKFYSHIESVFDFDYWKRDFFNKKTLKQSSAREYANVIKGFRKMVSGKNGFEYNTVDNILSRETVDKYLAGIERRANFRHKPVSDTHIKNRETMILQFLNHVCGELKMEKIKPRQFKITTSEKYNLTDDDIKRLLSHQTNNKYLKDIQDIIAVNSKLGLRISELLRIEKENITVKYDSVEIKFLETKKSKSRTVILLEEEQEIIKKRLSNSSKKIFNISYDVFKVHFKNLCKGVFKDETVQLFIAKRNVQKINNVLKSNAITSHALRRYAIQRNIARYGVEVARQFSGHSNTNIIYRHYAGFLDVKDLKDIMIQRDRLS